MLRHNTRYHDIFYEKYFVERTLGSQRSSIVYRIEICNMRHTNLKKKRFAFCLTNLVI